MLSDQWVNLNPNYLVKYFSQLTWQLYPASLSSFCLLINICRDKGNVIYKPEAN